MGAERSWFSEDTWNAAVWVGAGGIRAATRWGEVVRGIWSSHPRLAGRAAGRAAVAQKRAGEAAVIPRPRIYRSRAANVNADTGSPALRCKGWARDAEASSGPEKWVTAEGTLPPLMAQTLLSIPWAAEGGPGLS